MGKNHKIVITESIEELKHIRKKEKNSRRKSRILSLILTKEDKFDTREELADFIGIAAKTLYQWTKNYRSEGIDGLLSIRSGGKRRGAVPESIHKRLKEKLHSSESPLQGYNDAVEWVKQEFDCTIKYHTLRAFMIKNYGTKLKTPRKSHYKKDPEAFSAFKKTF